MISKIDQDFIKNSCQELADSFVGQSVNLSAFTGSSFIFFYLLHERSSHTI